MSGNNNSSCFSHNSPPTHPCPHPLPHPIPFLSTQHHHYHPTHAHPESPARIIPNPQSWQCVHTTGQQGNGRASEGGKRKGGETGWVNLALGHTLEGDTDFERPVTRDGYTRETFERNKPIFLRLLFFFFISVSLSVSVSVSLSLSLSLCLSTLVYYMANM